MDDSPTKNGCLETLDEAAPILASVQHELMQKLKLGHIEAAFQTNDHIRKIDASLAGLTHFCRGDESVMDLLYRLNLQRRGTMKGIMRSVEDGSKAEIGFDTNWEFLESQMFFEEQTQITKVSFVGSHKCKIMPKSLLLMENGDLLVSSYAANGVKVRAYKTSPF